MTFEQILTILRDTTKTDWQKAADLHAMLADYQPVEAPVRQEGKKQRRRGPNKPKPASGNVGAFTAGSANSHEKAQD